MDSMSNRAASERALDALVSAAVLATVAFRLGDGDGLITALRSLSRAVDLWDRIDPERAAAAFQARTTAGCVLTGGRGGPSCKPAP